MPSNQGRKLTKAQKAKKQQEGEEERRLREEEEARLQAEKDEQESLARERKQQEIERLELKDLERREDELNDLRHLLEENYTAVTQWKNDAVEKAKWEKYICCDGTPDPSIQQDINTYIGLWRDNLEVDTNSVLEKCNDTLKGSHCHDLLMVKAKKLSVFEHGRIEELQKQDLSQRTITAELIEELEALLRDVTDPQESQKLQEMLRNLQELIHKKHLLTTEEILKRASANVDTETGNMQTVVKDDNITLCLWANLKKNPRFKGLKFEEAALGFELPKHLAVSNIAVSILHTRYDHLSSLARMAHLKMHSPSQRSLAGGEEAPADIEPGEKETNKQEVMTQQGRDEEEEQSTQGLEERKSASSFKSRINSTQSARGSGSHIQTQMEALEVEGDFISSPVQPALVNHGVHVVDLMQYTPLGGVFYYDMFYLPPQAHQVNGWEIRQLLDKGPQTFPYPTNKSNFDDSDCLTCPPVGVSVTLPDSVVFLETPQVARWDAAGKQWRMDGIIDFSYKEEDSEISFKMDSFQAFVLMQETYANFPFQSWELRPLGQDSAVFTVKGALIDVCIMIQGNRCMLQLGNERGLSYLEGQWMSVPALQKAMLNAGINVFVNEYSEKYVSTSGKEPLTEHATYEQMAVFASACAFSWSKWNSKCGSEHLVMQVCEHHGPDPVPKDSWSLYLLGAQRSLKLEITEKSEAFSTDHYPGSEFHSTFIHMLQDSMTTEGIAKTRESNYLFVDTIQSLLCSTRPLMFS